MNIKCWGNGERVFLGVHGWAGNHRTFKPLGDNVPRDARFYSVDLPGYGESPAPKDWNIAYIADELSRITSDITKDALTLVGYCGGAALCILVADKAPERVSRLALIDPFAYMPWYFRIFTLGEFGRRAYMATFASARGRKTTNALLRSKRSADTDLTESFKNVNHELTHTVLRAFLEFPPYKTFAELRTAVDLVYGDKSFRAIKHGVELWKELWPHARVYELRNAGHDPIREATPQLLEIVFEQTPCN